MLCNSKHYYSLGHLLPICPFWCSQLGRNISFFIPDAGNKFSIRKTVCKDFRNYTPSKITLIFFRIMFFYVTSCQLVDGVERVWERHVGRDSVVRVVTHYGLDGPGIESLWGWDFPHPSRPSLGPTQPLYNGSQVSFSAVKRPGRGFDHPPPSSAEVKERVNLYLCSPSGPSWRVLGWIFAFKYYIKYYINILKIVFCLMMDSPCARNM
jgi:hypothetical protein